MVTRSEASNLDGVVSFQLLDALPSCEQGDQDEPFFCFWVKMRRISCTFDALVVQGGEQFGLIG